MIASGRSVPRISTNARRWKHELPAPLDRRLWILPLERSRKHNPPEPVGKIALVPSLNLLQMRPQRFLQSIRQHCAPILLALSPADRDLAALEINVLHADLEAFLQPQSRAVEQRRDEPAHTGHLVEDAFHFINGQHDRNANRRRRARHRLNPAWIHAEYVAIQKQNCAQCLVLRRRAHLSLNGEPTQKRGDLTRAHAGWMRLPVKYDVSSNPVDVQERRARRDEISVPLIV